MPHQSLGFLVGFLPGLLVGFCSALLLITLWNSPIAVYYTKEREVVGERVNSFTHHNDHYQLLEKHSAEFPASRSTSESSNGLCGKAYLESSRPVQRVPFLLLVLVHSSPTSQQRRRAIRETWLSDSHHQWKYVARFVVGIAGLNPEDLELLACENKEHRDMVFLPELHDNETLEYSSSQKLLLSFAWAEENVVYHYLFKCMDSTFVILDVVSSELENRTSTTDLLWGFFAGGIQATNKGHLKESGWFLCTHYLPYPQGGGYVISQGLVSMLSALGPDLDHYMHDDVALGVWLSPFSGIQYVHDVRFNTGYYSRGCNNVYVVTHRETGQSMYKKYASVKKKSPLCEVELVSRPSYIYDWTVPADRCCVRKVGIP